MRADAAVKKKKRIVDGIVKGKLSLIRRKTHRDRKRVIRASINPVNVDVAPAPVIVTGGGGGGVSSPAVEAAILKILQRMDSMPAPAPRSGSGDEGLIEEFGFQQEALLEEMRAMRQQAGAGSGGSEVKVASKRRPESSGKQEGIKLLTLEEMAELGLEDRFEEIQRAKEEESQELRNVNQTYPLMQSPLNAERTLTWANIRYNQQTKSLVYTVIEPQMSPEEEQVFKEIQVKLQERMDVNFEGGGAFQQEFLVNKVYEFLNYFGYVLSPDQLEKVIYFVVRDFIGLNNLEPLLHDPAIEDISCDGFSIPVFIAHNNPLFGEIATSVVFEEKDQLDNFVMKLSQRCGRAISVADPLLDGALPDGSRVQATFGTDISKRGSNFTIRKFSKEPVTPIKMVRTGTVTPEVLAYLWLAVEAGKSVLVSGATATGKTTMLNAISLFIKPEQKIVSIEDTAELRLPHPNWLPQVARAAAGSHGVGGVSMFDLLKAALRQRPDYLLVGEVRGDEAAIMFQAMSTGHAGMSTIHAENMEKLINRLTTKPINLPAVLLESLDIVVFLIRARLGKHYVRRVNQLVEIAGVDGDTKEVVTRFVFEWDPTEDNIGALEESVVMEKVRVSRGISKDEILAELYRRSKLLEWLNDNNIVDFERVSKFIETYYVDPERIRQWTRGEV